MRKLLLSILLVSGSIGMGFAQSAKKSCSTKVICCDPSTACGPANTKVAEAKVISDLRNEIADLKRLLGQSDVEINDPVLSQTELKKLPLDIENNPDDASLLILYMEVMSLKSTLDEQDIASKSFNSKAQLVSSLQGEIRVLKDQWVSNRE